MHSSDTKIPITAYFSKLDSLKIKLNCMHTSIRGSICTHTLSLSLWDMHKSCMDQSAFKTSPTLWVLNAINVADLLHEKRGGTGAEWAYADWHLVAFPFLLLGHTCTHTRPRHAHAYAHTRIHTRKKSHAHAHANTHTQCTCNEVSWLSTQYHTMIQRCMWAFLDM